jgi:phosphatidylinositol glycan class N
MLFGYIAFFGTGNIASISSFEISSTYRFTTIFDPFLMTALLIWKVIIPFLSVALAYRIMNRKLSINESGTFLIVVALSDVLSMNFFFLVKDNGSWKDIGMSISHFAIANAYIVIQLLLFGITQLILKGLYLSSEDKKLKKP